LDFDGGFPIARIPLAIALMDHPSYKSCCLHPSSGGHPMDRGFVVQIERELARLESERKRLDGEIAGLIRARDIYLGRSDETNAREAIQQGRRRRQTAGRSLRDIAADVLRDHPEGLSSSEVYSLAVEREQREIKKSSFVSAMSVAAKDGDFAFQNGIYRLPTAAAEFSGAAEAEAEEGADRDDAPPSEIDPFIRRIEDAAA
jgi:hypothetical protein